MARPSRWQQFTQNFNAMNSTMNDAFKKFETGKASKADYFSDELDKEGNKVKLTGTALDKAKNDAMARIYEKYGDNEGAAKMRKNNVELQGLAAQKAASEAATRASNLQSAALERTAGYNQTINSLLTDVGNQEFESQAAEDAYLIKQLKAADLPPEMRSKALESVKTFTGEAIALESQRLISGAQKAMRGGLDSFTNWYNTEVADGANIEYDTTDGVTTIYAVTGEGEDQRKTVIATGEGEDGADQAAHMLLKRVQDSSTVMGAAMDNLAYRQSKQNLSSSKAKDKLIEAQIADMKEMTKQRGISGYLNAQQMQLIAAQTVEILYGLDPNRRLTQSEKDREWAKFSAKLGAAGQPPEAIEAMREMFYNSLTNDDEYTVRPKQ